MRETQALQRNFDNDIDTINQYGDGVKEVFNLPVRNWELLIDCFDEANKRKFKLTPVQCKIAVEYAKKGQLPNVVFEGFGFSAHQYGALVTRYNQAESRLMELQTKEVLDEIEYEEFQSLMRNPYRILMSDIARARAVANLADWELFNEKALKTDELLIMKLKANNKEFFTEKEGNAPATITINIGGITLEE